MAVVYPDFMDLTVPMAGSPQSTAYDKLLWTSEIATIELDPAWYNGNPTGPWTRGIALLEESDSMNLTSPAHHTAPSKTDDFESFLAGIRKSASAEPGAVIDQICKRRVAVLRAAEPHPGRPLSESIALAEAHGSTVMASCESLSALRDYVALEIYQSLERDFRRTLVETAGLGVVVLGRRLADRPLLRVI